MFFADPVAAFRNIKRAMKRHGRLLLAVFRTGPENPWATASVAAIRHLVPPSAPLGPEDPGQFSWSDPARARRILDGAGFNDGSLSHTIGKRPLLVPKAMADQNGLTVCGQGGSIRVLGD
jgi:hypothetical protein